MTILISACLLGENCKYNGGNNLHPELTKLQKEHRVIPVCPEVLGGLPTPRVPAEIVHGVVRNRDGVSVDEAFRAGAGRALALAKENKPDLIILQSRSPSCGVGRVYDGSFTGRLVSGNGIFAQMAMEAGFSVVDAEEWETSTHT